MNFQLSLQDQFASSSICFGCGPANQQGLQIKSFVEGDLIVAHFTPKSFHSAFPAVLNGGIIGALLDCHCNWAASYYFMQKNKLSAPPCTVTAEYSVQLKRPTPMNTELKLVAQLKLIQENKITVYGELMANEKICDTCTGIFVVVDETHPAFHRW
ncbi:MAG: thioesterase [Gammaproteobacteria bacterium RIFCSPHIGHO2_02_FULL_39_13]|nr:MAG: thioesterase [Gammaproteobacteria bacterium RIFCSPHIGHO2_02_FULL_39_13]OGT49795.1 MAG: thioesterase [Gammaproteobacteria bacterium RIFCSPHIGHO2_12_FULL_39_24]